MRLSNHMVQFLYLRNTNYILNRMMRTFLLLLALLAATFIYAQTPFTLNGYSITPEKNICALRRGKNKAIKTLGSTVNGKYYLIAQFKATPTQDEITNLKEKGLTLHDYLAPQTYYVTLDSAQIKNCLKKTPIVSLIPIAWEWKVSSLVRQDTIPDFARKGNNIGIDVTYQGLSPEGVAARLHALGYTDLPHIAGEPFYTFEIWLPRQDIEKLAQQPWVKLIRMVSPPAVLFQQSILPVNR